MSQLEVCNNNIFLNCQPKHFYGYSEEPSQKKHLIETVLLSTQNIIMIKLTGKKIFIILFLIISFIRAYVKPI